MPHSRTLPTPSIPNPKSNSTTVTFYGASTIAAPASLIWSTLLDLPSYPSWNTFTPDPIPTPPPQDIVPGLELHFTAYLNPPSSKHHNKGNKTHVKISDLQPGKKICWTSFGQYPPWALFTERVTEIQDFGDGKCELRSYETMRGLLVPVVKLVVGGRLDEAFRRFTGEVGGEVGRRMGVEEMGMGKGVVNPVRGFGEGVVGGGGDDEEDD